MQTNNPDKEFPYDCVKCHFPTTMDDAEAPSASGKCVCIRCKNNMLNQQLVMPKELRREIIAIAGEIPKGDLL